MAETRRSEPVGGLYDRQRDDAPARSFFALPRFPTSVKELFFPREEHEGPTLLSQTFGQVATILAAVGAADLLLIKSTARSNGTQLKTRKPFTSFQLSILATGTTFLQHGLARLNGLDNWRANEWGPASVVWMRQNAVLRLEMIIISNRWGTCMPLVDLASVGFCFFAAHLGTSFASHALSKNQEQRHMVLKAMMTPLCAGAIVAGLLAKCEGGKGSIERHEDVYRTFRNILFDFQREALRRSLETYAGRVDIIIIQKTVRSLSTAGARLLTHLMQRYNPSGALPKEVLWMLTGVAQMKFIQELDNVRRDLSIGPLLSEVAGSLLKAVKIV